ncbi:MAG: flagellar protein FlaG [Defluviitaleaceae bacterium]|nr:flagellar protein FlaG [Defluviitaleaceae bacterium]
MMEYSNTNIPAATDGNRSMNLQQRQPAAANQQQAPPVRRPESAAAAGQVRPPDTAERVERLERMPEVEMQSLVNQANLILEPRNLELVYRRHEGTDRYFLTIYNRDTQEIAREIPPEWSLDMLARVWEMTGIFMNERG